MKSFKQKCFSEAFNIFPTEFPHIDEKLPKMDEPTREQAKELLANVQAAAKGKLKDPLAFSAEKPRSVKIARDLMGKVDLKQLNKKFDKLSIQFGNGSRGNQGANNRGNLFEQEVIDDIELYLAEGLDAPFTYTKLMQKFHDQLFSNYVDIKAKVVPEGAKNQKRSLVWQGNMPLINDSTVDIGNLVTDISLMIESIDIRNRKETHFLSLKMGSQVTFANVGITKVFVEDEMKNNNLNPKAQALLDVFGIDHQRFLDIFNYFESPEKMSTSIKGYIDKNPNYNKKFLVNFLATGIGHNYWMVHQKKPGSQDIELYYQDMQRLIHSVRPKSVLVKYPEIGNAKRIDIKVQTSLYEFNVNIRNKQGKIYPSHIMIDYKPVK